jgi:DNA-binding NtrC family response regulator
MNKGGKILVVDDHVDLAENLAEILSGVGYQTVIADSAESALERVAAGDISALITDFRLPQKSGADLIADLRRRGVDIPAIVMSAYTDDDTIRASERAGAIEVLPKPVDLPRLMSLVDSLGGNDSLVLVVDDNKALADNLAEVLQSRGYKTLVTSTAAEAFAQHARPRAAIVDYRLPDISGVEVAERLTSRDPRIRVLFMSGFASELRTELRGPLARAATLEKPVNVAQLLDWVADAVGLGHGQATRPPR